MKNFREYVLIRDSVEDFKAMTSTPEGPVPPDKTNGSPPPEEQEGKALLYKAVKLMIEKNPAEVMTFLDSSGDEEIRSLVDKAKQKRGGMNTEKGLGNLGLDDMERVKTPNADRASSPEDNDNDGGQY